MLLLEAFSRMDKQMTDHRESNHSLIIILTLDEQEEENDDDTKENKERGER